MTRLAHQIVAGVAIVFGAGACGHTFTATTQTTMASGSGNGHVVSWLWGAERGTAEADCDGDPVGRVRLSRNFGHVLISFITLGIVNVADYEYECAQPRFVIPAATSGAP